MKAIIGFIIALAVIGGGYYLVTQNPAPTENTGENALMEKNDVPKSGVYSVSTEESSVAWEGSKPLIAGYTHRGTIAVSEGMITVGENTASGSFTIDMNTIKVTSLGGGKVDQESQLEGHLKADDFFGVEKFPTAKFVITNVTPTDTENTYTVVGTLTIKGIANEISFPAQIFEKDGAVHAVADFEIDRTLWGIDFGSSNIFTDLAENAIGNNIKLSLNLVAHSEGSMMMEKEEGAMEDGDRMTQ